MIEEILSAAVRSHPNWCNTRWRVQCIACREENYSNPIFWRQLSEKSKMGTIRSEKRHSSTFPAAFTNLYGISIGTYIYIRNSILSFRHSVWLVHTMRSSALPFNKLIFNDYWWSQGKSELFLRRKHLLLFHSLIQMVVYCNYLSEFYLLFHINSISSVWYMCNPWTADPKRQMGTISSEEHIPLFLSSSRTSIILKLTNSIGTTKNIYFVRYQFNTSLISGKHWPPNTKCEQFFEQRYFSFSLRVHKLGSF